MIIEGLQLYFNMFLLVRLHGPGPSLGEARSHGPEVR